MSFEIEIIKNESSYMWYADKVGETFEVNNYMPSCFLLLDGKKIIWKTDCNIKIKL